VARGRHAGRLHDLLGVRLRALDPRGGGRRPEGTHASLRELVDDPADEGRLGSHDDEVAVLLARGDDEALDIVGGDVEATHAVSGDAGIAGCAEDVGRPLASPQGTHESVLATSAADYEDTRHLYSADMKSSIGMADIDS
jgi:hypothetical protein